MPTPKQSRPYGTWHSPISPATMSGDHRLYDAKWDNHTATLVWQERRSGGSALVVQRPGHNPRDLVRDAKIGGQVLFGGGGFTVGHGHVYYVGAGGRIYAIPLDGGQSRAITPAFGETAAPTLSPNGRWLAYVHSYEGRDALAVVPVDGSQYPRKLFDGADFVMHPTWHPYGDRIACITWDHPHMPWNESRLNLLHFTSDAEPRVMAKQVIAGGNGGVSVFGASFSPDSGYLAYTSDRGGWWQLYLYDLDLEDHIQLTQDNADYGMPAWLQDMRTFAWSSDSRALYALRNSEGHTTLQRVPVDGREAEPVPGLERYTYLEQISVSRASGEVSVIAGATHIPDEIVSLHPDDDPLIRVTSSTHHLSSDYLVRAHDVSWESEDGVVVHGLYYPPKNPRFESSGAPPLIVYIHSGPTRQRFAKYFPEPHFFASRGFAVLEPNYRGSTGYGRAFKHMLHGNWGVAEVQDAARGAAYLVDRGLADGSRMVVMGESSGGFSVLQSLINLPDTYRAGIAQAPVTDQFALGEETHKFERYYNDSLLGALPGAAEIYRERSPLFNADKITTPVAMFHGEQDSVVPVVQSRGVAEALRRNGVPHVFKLYSDEGHSIRRPDNVTDYYDTVLRFLMQYVIYG